MNNIVAHQQQAANRLLDRLEIIDPTCIIAGGAPRNWFDGVPANDLDVYIHDPYPRSLVQDSGRYSNLLDTEVTSYLDDFDISKYEEFKKENPEIRSVLKTSWEGINVDLILCSVVTFNITSTFDCTMSRHWYKKGIIQMDDCAHFSRAIKTIFYTNVASKQYAKMREYYPDYTHIVMGDATMAFVQMDEMVRRFRRKEAEKRDRELLA